VTPNEVIERISNIPFILSSNQDHDHDHHNHYQQTTFQLPLSVLFVGAEEKIHKRLTPGTNMFI